MKREDLEEPLKEGVDYFDATPTIEELARMYGDLRERLQRTEAALELQASINANLIGNLRALLSEREKNSKPNALILPDRLQ